MKDFKSNRQMMTNDYVKKEKMRSFTQEDESKLHGILSVDIDK